jgi:hypothetical protein
MQRHDAYALLAGEMAAFRKLSYNELAALAGESSSQHVCAADATQYVIEVKIRWRTGTPGEILVEGMAATADFGPCGGSTNHLWCRHLAY